jgi:DNA-binding CsgD family transcriptional regulator
MTSRRFTAIAPRASEEVEMSFTRAELEVLRWLRIGRSNRDIAVILSKSEFTVKTQVQQMLAKTGLDNRVQLALLALHEEPPLPPALPE